jgi:hypothetical protein
VARFRAVKLTLDPRPLGAGTELKVDALLLDSALRVIVRKSIAVSAAGTSAPASATPSRRAPRKIAPPPVESVDEPADAPETPATTEETP